MQAPIAVRTRLLAPSQPSRYRASTLCSSPLTRSVNVTCTLSAPI